MEMLTAPRAKNSRASPFRVRTDANPNRFRGGDAGA
jgi:hypothetical protein